MSGQVIPPTQMQTVIAHQGETLDALCWRVFGKQMMGARVLEEALILNHGLADKEEVLPHGMAVNLPLTTKTATKKETVQLWE